MDTYIILYRYTQQGIERIKESPGRIEWLKDFAEEHGVKVKAFYSLMGRFDVMLILEAKSVEDLVKVNLKINSLGNVRSETLRAFKENEFVNLANQI